ncbi:MAG: SLC13 family permease [Kofleriaceae bacterium]
MTGALVVFVLTYLVISSTQLAWLGLDRPTGALVGAVAMVAVGALTFDAALAAIDLPVLTLLLGMLILAAYLEDARFFRYTAFVVLTRAGSARTLLWGLTFTAGGLSALLLNDTVCLLLTPLVVAVALEARLPVLPFLLALASSANIGGVVALSGNPQNMIVARAAHGALGFASYLAIALPVGVACLAANAAVLTWLFRAQLPRGPLIERDPPRPAFDRVLAAKALGGLALFLVLALAGVELAGAAIFAAAVVIVVARVPPRKILAQVDWSILVFFVGLFVVVAGLRATGLIEHAFAALRPAIGRDDVLGDLALVAVVVVGSNVVSNVPLVVIAVDWIPGLAHPGWSFLLLAMASTLAGNLTLLGSAANVIVLESAGPRGEIGFWRFARYGAVLTGASLVVAAAILALARVTGYAGWLGL